AADNPQPSTITATVTIAEGPGIPKELTEQPISLAFQAPDRLRIKAQINNETFEIGRNGQELWIWQPAKKFGVIGSPGVPRFSSRPDLLDNTKLDPLALPLSREQLAMAPLL